MVELDEARAAKERLRHDLAGRPGVRGVGLAPSDDGYRLQVNVATERDAEGLPADVDGVRVGVRVVGLVRARR